MKIKAVFLIFVFSFFLNFIWENLHSYLYANYMAGKITEFILSRASLADAVIITILALPFVFFKEMSAKSWLIIVFGIFVSIIIELYALKTGRWEYNEYMPMVPLLAVGLTPTIQLGLLGYISYRLVKKLMRYKGTIREDRLTNRCV